MKQKEVKPFDSAFRLIVFKKKFHTGIKKGSVIYAIISIVDGKKNLQNHIHLRLLLGLNF